MALVCYFISCSSTLNAVSRSTQLDHGCMCSLSPKAQVQFGDSDRRTNLAERAYGSRDAGGSQQPAIASSNLR